MNIPLNNGEELDRVSEADPWSPREVTITIKYGKGYEESWAVFRGGVAEIRAALIEYFGLSTPWADEVTLNELVIEATKVAHGTSHVARTLGGKAVSPSERVSESKGDAWSQAEADKSQGADSSADDKRAALQTQIAATTSVDALKRLWAENQDAFKDDESLMAEWKARGKELSSK